MTSHKHDHSHSHSHQHHEKPENSYWTRAHKDWKFWVAVTLMLISMAVYVLTLDEAIQPDTQKPSDVKQPVP